MKLWKFDRVKVLTIFYIRSVHKYFSVSHRFLGRNIRPFLGELLKSTLKMFLVLSRGNDKFRAGRRPARSPFLPIFLQGRRKARLYYICPRSHTKCYITSVQLPAFQISLTFIRFLFLFFRANIIPYLMNRILLSLFCKKFASLWKIKLRTPFWMINTVWAWIPKQILLLLWDCCILSFQITRRCGDTFKILHARTTSNFKDSGSLTCFLTIHNRKESYPSSYFNVKYSHYERSL